MKLAPFHLAYLYEDSRFQSFFSQYPHILKDQNSEIISEVDPDKIENKVTEEVIIGDIGKIAELTCNESFCFTLSNYIQFEAQCFLNQQALPYLDRLDRSIQEDIEGLFYSLTVEGTRLIEILNRVGYLIKTYALVENCNFFVVDDGSVFKGITGVTPDGVVPEDHEWNTHLMTIPLMAINNRKVYVANNPKKDPNYKIGDSGYCHKNLASFPVMFNNEIIGALNVANKVDGKIDEATIALISRFIPLVSQVLGTTYIESAMEHVQKTSAELSRYLSKRVVRNIENSAKTGELGGVSKKVVTLFSDIRSFTTLSEGISPEQLVTMLNYYFDHMGEIVDKYKGTLDKLVGDLIMVIWNVPHDQPEPELLAVKTAIEMQKVVQRTITPYWRNQGCTLPFSVGIGVTSGSAVVGNIGSKHFMNYTVIGDTINTAQRLESQAKSGEIWISEQVWDKVEGKVPRPIRKVKNIKLKGKEKPVLAYVLKPSR